MTLKNLKASTLKLQLISEEYLKLKYLLRILFFGIDHDPKPEKKHTPAANHDDDVFNEEQSSTDKFCLKIVRIHVW